MTQNSPKRNRHSSPGRNIDVLHFGKSPETLPKDPRVSTSLDIIDPVYRHLDPISVSLQERVKFGGKVTAITRQKEHVPKPFFFHLTTKGKECEITKAAILSAEIERQENIQRGPKQTHIKRDKTFKYQDRDFYDDLEAKELQRISDDVMRREQDIETAYVKYDDPEAFEDPTVFYSKHSGSPRASSPRSYKQKSSPRTSSYKKRQ